ncbi:pentatricopeptide repeat-containing protein [Striga asiatica]|uniref:Pentatricopeptide repeat-containing protein n=1 Tax=Striga asiatica TaxID=4170 RepID=A0A5A7QKA0_STRAF|nr:pentatricopeptide repeat-containing protein [Striga asiatica]
MIAQLPPAKMHIPAPIRAPTFLSRRRLFEQKLADLSNCTDLKQLKQMHALIYKHSLHDNLLVAPKLISALSLCRRMALAVKVFDQIPNPSSFQFNVLIKAYIKNSEPDRALEVFCRMQLSGVPPDNHTYQFLLKACSDLKSVGMIHALVEKCGFYMDPFLPNSMIDAYSKCGPEGIRAAKKVFDVMGERDVVSYNSIITGLVRGGQLVDARKVFDEMPQRDAVSWNAILDGYVKDGDMAQAFELFQKIPSRNVVSWSTVIFGFVKTGDLEMAKALFDRMPVKNLVTWTIMISGYAEKGLGKEAIRLYRQMERENFRPDDGACISILSASAESGLLGLGKKVYRSIMKNRPKCGTVVSNALVDMYCKCGSLDQAWRIFNQIEKKDLISWNAMIHGLAIHGHGPKALQLFNEMRIQGFEPDNVTFVAVLSACSRSGLIETGIRYFYRMESEYRISPRIEHYGCLIDLLGRGGRLDEAFRVLHEMPFEPNVVIWSSILAACRMHNAARLAEEVLGRIVKFEPLINNDNYNLLMSSLYASVGDWSSVANVRVTMRERVSGVSLIELDDRFHKFKAMDRSHWISERIYETVDGLNEHVRKIGSVSARGVDDILWGMPADHDVHEMKFLGGLGSTGLPIGIESGKKEQVLNWLKVCHVIYKRAELLKKQLVD